MDTTQTHTNTHNNPQTKEQEVNERLVRIGNEFSAGFSIMNRYDKTVTIFGSARFTEGHPAYEKAREISAALATHGYTLVTGGGGGIMEAGNRGAFEAGGQSVGLNIKLPHEQVLNAYTTDSMPFRYFFARKVLLAYNARAYVILPGGFGTLDELFEVITLVQTNKMPRVPIVLVGSEFWGDLDGFIRKHMLDGEKTISPGDEQLYTITDDTDEVVRIITEHQPVENHNHLIAVHE